jgi:chitin disaccharide deacetylase
VAVAWDHAGTDAPDAHTHAPLRRIWLCADDYGIAPGVNAAIRDLVLRSRLNATSVMVAAPSFSRAEAFSLSILNAGNRRVAIGLHLTLTAPFRPLTKDFAPLVDGAFLTLEGMMRGAFLRRLDVERIGAEVRAQLAAFAAAFGRAPDFIDGHRHVHLLPRVAPAVLAAVREVAPDAWVRQCGQPRAWRRPWTDPKGLVVDLLSRGMRRRATERGVATNPAFAGTYTYAEDAEFAVLFPQFLAATGEGGLIMCHPGMVDAELERLDPLTTLREREYAYLRADEFPQLLAQHGVALA